ncbi:MAG: HD-GYP domain-containing protein [Burkholderiaceae bacterium]
MSNPKRIAVSQVRCGMYIQRLDGSWLHHPFWRKSFALQDEADLKTLRESGITHVWIDLDRGDDVQPPPAEATPQIAQDEVDEVVEEAPDAEAPTGPAPDEEPVAVMEEPPAVHLGDTLQPGSSRLHRVGRKPPTTEDWVRARKICDQAREVVGTLFDDANAGRPIDAGSTRPLVDNIIDIVSDQPTTLSTLARLKKQDDYTYMHSVAVCSLMTTLALELGLNDAQVRESAMAGLLHDIGKMTVDLAILNKPGKLTDSEFDQIKDHTTNGFRILKDTGGVSDITLDVCLHHHERIDGRGYPDGLPEDKISLFAKMGTVCDVYDAITSDRPYEGLGARGRAAQHEQVGRRRIRHAGLSSIRQEPGRLSDRFPGPPAIGPAGRGRRPEPRGLAGAAGEDHFLGQQQDAGAARDPRPVGCRLPRQDRRA